MAKTKKPAQKGPKPEEVALGLAMAGLAASSVAKDLAGEARKEAHAVGERLSTFQQEDEERRMKRALPLVAVVVILIIACFIFGVGPVASRVFSWVAAPFVVPGLVERIEQLEARPTEIDVTVSRAQPREPMQVIEVKY